MELNNKVAVVTGAAQGIGKVIAMLLARKGASLVVCDINLDMANETANEIEVAGGKCLALKSDVTSVQDAEKIIK
ncbi:MAG: SDR family NAD(P)-dependent oxidoreductase, partial [Deltaproteobacteria bacterium]|nr:SDR family NAD(P)-dependent oxidoreductase [Deltaproteobacteria bacterium]